MNEITFKITDSPIKNEFSLKDEVIVTDNEHRKIESYIYLLFKQTIGKSRPYKSDFFDRNG